VPLLRRAAAALRGSGLGDRAILALLATMASASWVALF
jgi:hypothetical protein